MSINRKVVGAVALALSLGGIFIGFLIGAFGHLIGISNPRLSYYVFIAFQLAAFWVGIAAWQDKFGKAACLLAALSAVGSLAFLK